MVASSAASSGPRCRRTAPWTAPSAAALLCGRARIADQHGHPQRFLVHEPLAKEAVLAGKVTVVGSTCEALTTEMSKVLITVG
jgi:hypothetical protein